MNIKYIDGLYTETDLFKNSPFCFFNIGGNNLVRTTDHTHEATQDREVNNKLNGQAFAHLVNYCAHPVNSTCPLPKTAHPVNYLAHRKNRHTDFYK